MAIATNLIVLGQGYKQDWSSLEGNRNPFSTVVMAHLKAQETKKDYEIRKDWKLRLRTPREAMTLYLDLNQRIHDVLLLALQSKTIALAPFVIDLIPFADSTL